MSEEVDQCRRRDRRRRTSVALVMLLATVGAMVVHPESAFANNFGSICDNATDCVSLANNSNHAVRYVNLSDEAPHGIPNMTVAADWAVTQYNGTDLNVYRDQSDPLPDLELHDYNYGPTGWVGIAKCPATNTGTGGSHPNRWCRGQQNIYNGNYYWYDYGYFDTDYQRRVVSCHEMGHSVGLRHNVLTTNSCMWTYVTEATGSVLSQHDKDHINARY
ncbi:matrixin family metalloprotease [Micromonospora sp. NPDC048898]|uniref:matrixin family metalloprotease n=1 Tax=Micromonospora sp. NPDC048898 TaxID=3364260 RepID=UPI003713B917